MNQNVGWAWLKLSDQENHRGIGGASVVVMRFLVGLTQGITQEWVVFIVSSFSPVLRSLTVYSVSTVEALRKT